MENQNGKITVYPSYVKYISFLMLSIVFTFRCMFLSYTATIDVIINQAYSSILVVVIGILGLLFFLPISCYILNRIIIKKPSLIIDENGIYDNASYTSIGFLPWSEIEAAFIWIQKYKVGSQKVVGIKLKNKDKFIDKFHGLKKTILKVSNYPVNIPQNGINMSIDDIYNTINDYVNKCKSEYRPKVSTR